MVLRITAPIILLLGTLPFSLAAQEPTDQLTESNPLVVFIGDRDHGDESQLVFEAIQTHVGDPRADLQLHWSDSFPPELEAQKELVTDLLHENDAKAVIWCDFKHQEPSIHFYSSETESRGVVVRSIDTTDRKVAAETFAVIVRAWMTTLLAHENDEQDNDSAAEEIREISSSQDSAGSPEVIANVQLEKKEESPGGLISLEAAWVASVVSSDNPFSQGFSVGVGFRFLKFWQILASYQFVETIETNRADVHMTLRRHPFWLQGRFTKFFGRITVGAGLALGLDYATEKHTSEIAVGEQSAEMRVSIAPLFITSVRLVSDLHAFFHLGAEIFLSQGRYVVLTTEGREEVLKPWPVQPIGLVGLSFEFL